MANNRNKVLPSSVLDQFKYEIANELGITPQIRNGSWDQITSSNCGKVGGNIGGKMVRLMVRNAEEALKNKYGL